MENIVIKVKSLKHGQKVKKYFLKLGVAVGELEFSRINGYYGMFNGKFDFNLLPYNSKVIELPSKKTEIINLLKARMHNRPQCNYEISYNAALQFAIDLLKNKI